MLNYLVKQCSTFNVLSTIDWLNIVLPNNFAGFMRIYKAESPSSNYMGMIIYN